MILAALLQHERRGGAGKAPGGGFCLLIVTWLFVRCCHSGSSSMATTDHLVHLIAPAKI
jgi:hypothetical protein